MLPKIWKVIGVNSTGQTLTFNSNARINLKITGWRKNPVTGEVHYQQLDDDDFSFVAGSTLADAAEVMASEHDNSDEKLDGILVQAELKHDEGTLADGPFKLYLDGGDLTGELVSDADGYDTAALAALTSIGDLTWHASGGNDEWMRSPVFSVKNDTV